MQETGFCEILFQRLRKNKKCIEIESGTSYTYSVIQIKTCYLI